MGFQDSVENVADCPFKKGGNVMRWYFVEVEKHHEEDVLELMKSSPFEAFLPKKQRYFKKQVLVTWVERLLFPGTIMITTSLIYKTVQRMAFSAFRYISVDSFRRKRVFLPPGR